MDKAFEKVPEKEATPDRIREVAKGQIGVMMKFFRGKGTWNEVQDAIDRMIPTLTMMESKEACKNIELLKVAEEIVKMNLAAFSFGYFAGKTFKKGG